MGLVVHLMWLCSAHWRPPCSITPNVLANSRNIHHRPALLWRFRDSGAGYKTADLVTYLLSVALSPNMQMYVLNTVEVSGGGRERKASRFTKICDAACVLQALCAVRCVASLTYWSSRSMRLISHRCSRRAARMQFKYDASLAVLLGLLCHCFSTHLYQPASQRMVRLGRTLFAQQLHSFSTSNDTRFSFKKGFRCSHASIF